MTTIRLIFFSITFCVVLHSFNILSFSGTFVPEKAKGSLILNAQGDFVGSRLIAQAFTSDRYFHPRPSACDYNASASSGSNLSPTNPELAIRAQRIITTNGATQNSPIPADLVTTSGSGLDPDITLAAARYQLSRVARARGIAEEELAKLLTTAATVNVLELNIALDRLAH